MGNAPTESSASSSFVLCPANYSYVPAQVGFTTSGFCVAKYEAKDSGGIAISTPAGTPEISITKTSAETKCQANTPSGKYDLISNTEWMSIARNAEAVSANWSSGIVGTGYMAMGHQYYLPGVTCNGNQEYGFSDADVIKDSNCSGNIVFLQRRTYVLNNGEVVWDLGGNVKEWIKDIITTPVGSVPTFSDDYISYLNADSKAVVWTLNSVDSGDYFNLFGPAVSTVNCNSAGDEYCGIGKAGMSHVGTALVRGGNVGGGNAYGLYSMSTYQIAENTFANVGYRCTYHP